MAIRFNAQKAAQKGYTKADWDTVSDNPTLTAKEIKSLRPAKEVLPAAFFDELEKARKARGRPRVEKPKEAVTLRLDPDLIARFKARGKDWRTKMAEALERA